MTSTTQERILPKPIRKPFYAAVGSADLAIQKTRELPTEAISRMKTTTTQTVNTVVALPVKAAQLSGKATEFYGELAVRGQRLVRAIRRQPATEAAIAEAKAAKRQAKGATTSATRATQAAVEAVESAADKIG
ncbi:MAG: hypothetical protein LC640_04580 [Frankia sp.]|nr:hypothetical protein [Frankia sp.]